MVFPLEPSLLADRANQSFAQILLWMRDNNMAETLCMFEYMVRTTNPVERPSGLGQLPDEVSTLHLCAFYTLMIESQSGLT